MNRPAATNSFVSFFFFLFVTSQVSRAFFLLAQGFCLVKWRKHFQLKTTDASRSGSCSPFRQILRRRKTSGVTSRAVLDRVTLTLNVTSISAEARPVHGSDSRNVWVRVGTTPIRDMLSCGVCNASVLDTFTSKEYGNCKQNNQKFFLKFNSCKSHRGDL